MTDSTKDHSSTPKVPSHVAYHVRDQKSGASYWTRIGSAWAHADGKGFNIQIETFPLDGRVSLRRPSESNQ